MNGTETFVGAEVPNDYLVAHFIVLVASSSTTSSSCSTTLLSTLTTPQYGFTVHARNAMFTLEVPVLPKFLFL